MREVVPEVGKPFIYAVELTSRKFWSRPATPTLVTHFGPPLGGPGGARISIHVPEIAQIHSCWLPLSDSPLAWKKRRGLLPQKRHPPPGDMGQSRFSQCKSWIAGVVQVNTLFTVLRNASSKVRDTFFSSNPKEPILSKSPDQVRKYELWLVRPKRKFLVTKLWAFVSAPLVRADFVSVFPKRAACQHKCSTLASAAS